LDPADSIREEKKKKILESSFEKGAGTEKWENLRTDSQKSQKMKKKQPQGGKGRKMGHCSGTAIPTQEPGKKGGGGGSKRVKDSKDERQNIFGGFDKKNKKKRGLKTGPGGGDTRKSYDGTKKSKAKAVGLYKTKKKGRGRLPKKKGKRGTRIRRENLVRGQ